MEAVTFAPCICYLTSEVRLLSTTVKLTASTLKASGTTKETRG
jgi:hypothetical protein